MILRLQVVVASLLGWLGLDWEIDMLWFPLPTRAAITDWIYASAGAHVTMSNGTCLSDGR